MVAVANENANCTTWRRRQESALAVMMILIKVKRFFFFLSNCSNHGNISLTFVLLGEFDYFN